LYGPLNAAVSPAVAERWIDRLLNVNEITADRAQCIAHVGARTGDPARDITETAAERAADRLAGAGEHEAARHLRVVAESSASEKGRLFGETLPEGLKLA
jgi:hypothetical protein